jgi:hypothetical protein
MGQFTEVTVGFYRPYWGVNVVRSRPRTTPGWHSAASDPGPGLRLLRDVTAVPAVTVTVGGSIFNW